MLYVISFLNLCHSRFNHVNEVLIVIQYAMKLYIITD